MASRRDLKKEFEDGERPSGADFAALIDSFLHKEEDGLTFDIDGGQNMNLSLPGGLKLGNSDSNVGGTLRLHDNRLQFYDSENGQWREFGGSFQPVGTAGAVSYTGGNVGIGITEPEAKLHVKGNLRLNIGEGLEFLGEDSYFNSTGDARIFRMIDSNGSGGNVDGGIAIEGFTSRDQRRKPIVAIKGNGNVGIGTTDPSQKLDVNGGLNVTGSLDVEGGLNVTGNISGSRLEFSPPVGAIDTNNEIEFTRRLTNSRLDSTNTLKLSLSEPPGRGESEPTYAFWIGHRYLYGNLFRLEYFDQKFSVNSNGNVWVAGNLSAQDLTIRSANKSGYVSDHFVNAVGEPIEQGDVVVLSEHPVSRFYATNNNVPIPEVDLTDRAYDTRVCGIVAKVTTEADLPYVEAEASPIAPEVLAKLSPEALQGQVPLEELPEEIATSLQPPHPLKSLAATAQAGMNTTVVQDKQMGSMVTMGCFSYCKVDADIAAISVGDLLTTSPTRGHAQKVLEPQQAIGAIVGKALAPLSSGKGKIPVLVMLQ